jgi:GT2 family glycosyltransferase
MGSSEKMNIISITAIVTACQRIDQTLVTLQKIKACEPRPDEILVHIDANQTHCEAAIRDAFSEVKVICSEECIGPGGGRNKLIAAAKNEFIASFDDDSYPMDVNYFARVQTLFEKFPAASILCAVVYHQGQDIEPDTQVAEWVSDFSGGACIYRRTAFQSTGGYVPLPVAYGMEEVDIALRLHAQGGRILRSSWLRVFHDTDLKRHAHPEVTAGSIANLALLTYLRYPPSLWIVGIAQCCNRILWLVRNGRRRGVLSGLLRIPRHLIQYRRFRSFLPTKAVKSYLELRRQPKQASAT